MLVRLALLGTLSDSRALGYRESTVKKRRLRAEFAPRWRQHLPYQLIRLQRQRNCSFFVGSVRFHATLRTIHAENMIRLTRAA